MYEQWVNTTLPVYMKYYVFDVKNPEDVMAGTAVPAVEQMGPYSYRYNNNNNNNNKILMTLPLRGFSVTVNYNKNYNHRIIKITMISITKIKKKLQ